MQEHQAVDILDKIYCKIDRSNVELRADVKELRTDVKEARDKAGEAASEVKAQKEYFQDHKEADAKLQGKVDNFVEKITTYGVYIAIGKYLATAGVGAIIALIVKSLIT